MSATWIRAQELGQPLTWMVSGWLKVGSRSSSSATSRVALALVSVMASLQYSIPVQAIAPRRNVPGSASRPRLAMVATSASTWSAGIPTTTRLCSTVSRIPRPPAASTAPASAVRAVPDIRPTVGFAPIEK
jgi:hypothetical protein